jgi:Lytic transglycolase
MPTSRTIGISFACLVTSACAIARTPEKNASHYPGEGAGTALGNAQLPTARPASFDCGVVREGRPANNSFERGELWRSSFEPTVEVCDGGTDPCCGPAYAVERTQFGKAAWYDLVGSKTASGETLDTVTATAAHRSLPLASFAKVIDLDNGRSVIVKINDRGPYTRGRIIDLSPRAADALDMKSAGVANVVIEPLLKQAPPTLAAFQTFDTIETP